MLTDELRNFLLTKYCNSSYWRDIVGLDKEDDWKLKIDDSKINYNNINFSEYMCEYDSRVLLSQKILNNKYRTGLDICLLTSLFNAYPKLFYNDPKNIRKYRYHKLGEKYSTLKEVIKLFNNKFDKKILYESSFNTNIIVEDLKNNCPIILCRDNLHLDKTGHAVSIYGINDCGVYYFENGKDTLINSMCIELAQKLFSYCFNPNIDINKVNRIIEKLNLEEPYKFIMNNYLYFFTDKNIEMSIKVYNKLKRVFLYKKENLMSFLSIKYLYILSNLKCIRIDKNIKFSERDKLEFGIKTENYYTQSFIDLSNRLKQLI